VRLLPSLVGVEEGGDENRPDGGGGGGGEMGGGAKGAPVGTAQFRAKQ
jgi:hypothetical protein